VIDVATGGGDVQDGRMVVKLVTIGLARAKIGAAER
jgi:hypothetical protein